MYGGDPRDGFRLIDDTSPRTVLRFRSDRYCLLAKIAELAVAGYGDKAAPKNVKLAGGFGDGVEGGSSPSEKGWDSPPETLRGGDAYQ
jgi:hypothetical protein